MLFNWVDEHGDCEIGIRFMYPEPIKRLSEPIPLDWLICPVNRLAEHMAKYADGKVCVDKLIAAMKGELVIGVEPRKVICIIEKFRKDNSGKRFKEATLFKTQTVCHPEDTYSKRVGRFGAFKRAVQTFIDSTPEDVIDNNGGESEARRKFWDAFRDSGCKFPSSMELQNAYHRIWDEDELELTIEEPW